MAASTPHNSYGFPRISRAHGATSEETRISDSVLRTCHTMLCSLSNAPNVLATNTYRRLPQIYMDNGPKMSQLTWFLQEWILPIGKFLFMEIGIFLKSRRKGIRIRCGRLREFRCRDRVIQ